jgi:phosphopantothenoylcysteine decarboxylase/phosphopantothenate--cysteine ligase
MSGSNLAFILTGSIAGYKACDAISQLVQRGHRVRAVATPAALRFVGEATLEGLTGERVLTGLFEPGAALEHIALTRWADLVVVCPATANTLNRLAAGLADDFAGALFLAHDRAKPFLVAPAMNPAMWRHPATAAAAARLREWGVRFVAAGEGRTACGEVGVGRLAEPAELVAAIEAALAPPAARRRILVTSGGTAEPIDAVRVLTNTSTGRTGAMIAGHFARGGHDVVLLRARGSAPLAERGREETFVSFAELDAALVRLLAAESFDAVIHAAAVGDFGVESVEVDGVVRPPAGGKLASSSAPVLRLRRHPKLVDGLRARSCNPALRVIAFKLTQAATGEGRRAAVAELLAHTALDLVVHNDLADRGEGDAFPADIYGPDGACAAHCAGRSELGPALERLLDSPALCSRSTPHAHAPLP